MGGVSGRANALNSAGVVMGLSGIGSIGGFDYHAFVYGADGILDLNALVGELGGLQLVNALDVNDAGQILAQACNREDCLYVRLDPPPCACHRAAQRSMSMCMMPSSS